MTIDDKTINWKHVGKDARTVVNELLGAKKFRYMGETEYPELSRDHVYSLSYGLRIGRGNELIIHDETRGVWLDYNREYFLNDFWEIK